MKKIQLLTGLFSVEGGLREVGAGISRSRYAVEWPVGRNTDVIGTVVLTGLACVSVRGGLLAGFHKITDNLFEAQLSSHR